MEMEWEKQGFQIQILVGDGYLTGSLRCTMDPIDAFTLQIWNTIIQKYTQNGIQITDEKWYQMCKIRSTSTNSPVWREF